MSKGNVLIVEDSQDVRNVMAEIVSLFGYNVSVAKDGLDAWDKIASFSYDLIITDMGMPKMGGEDLVRNMRQDDINTPVILVAGVDIQRGIFSGKALINCRFVQKPFTIEDIGQTISLLLDTDVEKEKKQKKLNR
jgi:two-component system response regulator (stage 0 sporulation protein F)